MKKYNDYTSQLVGESVEAILSDKAKLSLYKKSSNSDIPVSILEEVYRRGYTIWNDKFGGTPEQFAFDRVNSFIAGGFAAQLDEDLRNWFNPSHPEGGWKRINSKGEAIGPCAREPGEPKPKCMSNEKIAKLSKKERAAAVAAKRRHDPVADRSGKGGKPVNVSNFGKGKISEEYLEEKNAPTNPSLWSKAKSLARSKFDVYPSAYANGWAAKWYKSKGGGWKSVSEESELEEKCWTGYKQVGMKKKGERMVPNCVPVKEEELNKKVMTPEQIADKHGVSVESLNKCLKRGIQVEKEHTTHAEEARRIALAHLGEDPNYYKKLDKAGLEEDAEAHSKDFRKPSSRFIGSNELVDIYKSQTPGQIIKKVIREHLQEVAMAMPPAVTPPAIVGQVRPGIRVAPRPTEVSGRATGRMAGQAGSMTGKVQTTRAAPPRAPTSTMPAGQAGSMRATPTKTSMSFSQGGSNVGQKMAAAKQTSPVVKGMADAGRSAMAGVEKAAPAVAKGLGTVARIASGPAATAAMAVMSPTPAGAGEDEKKRQETLKSYNPYKAQGRSVSDYEKQTLTPQKYETPKPAPAPKVDAPTPPSRPEFFSRGEAFKAAREKAGGGEGQFKYDNKPFQTNVPGEKYIAPEKQKQTGVEAESGGKTLKKIKEAIAEATYKGKTVPLNKPMKGDVKKSKVFVDPDGDGKAQKVNFGDKNMSIKKDQPARKRSYCARSGGISGTNDKTSANYWSRRAWNCEETEVNELSVPAGTTGKRTTVSTPMVAVRMASGKIEKHPPGKSGSSGGGGNGAE